jgi:hypothetical protein
MENEKETNLESRRKILKYAIYTPPALMLMSKANADSIAASTGTSTDTPTGNESGSCANAATDGVTNEWDIVCNFFK